MSVVYDVVYDNHQRIMAQGGCFGNMVVGSWSLWGTDSGRYGARHGISHASQAQSEARNAASRLINSDTPHLFIQFHVKPNASIWGSSAPYGSIVNAHQDYFNAMANLVPQVAWLRGMVSVHPEFGVVRIYVKGQPADKVMMALFLFRNLSHYSYGHTYQKLINDFNMNVLPALYLAHMVTYTPRTPFTAETWKFNSQGEYTLQRPEAFGRQSLINILRADENWNPWFQGDWNTQGGYLRDSNMWGEENFTVVGGRSGSRSLNMCLCVQNDQPLFTGSELNFEGGYLLTGIGDTHRVLTPELVVRAVQEYGEVCREAGVEPFYR